MSYTTGSAKPLESITLDDALNFPIWEWALDEEGNNGHDETWQRPITGTRNVTDEMYSPIITLRIENSDLYASAEYDNGTDGIQAIAVWKDSAWKTLKDVALQAPITLIAIPSINGKENVRFVCSDLSADTAFSS